jgi:hypothetical protein
MDMAINPKKPLVDPTEAALSAIQEALNARDNDGSEPDLLDLRSNIEPILSDIKKDLRHDGIAINTKASIYETLAESWIGLLLLQLALIGGAVAVTRGLPTLEHWKMLFIALGASCVGFGIAFLLNHRLNRQQAHELEVDYFALKARADLLVSKVSLLSKPESGDASMFAPSEAAYPHR